MRSENSGLIDLDALMKQAHGADDSLEAITPPPRRLERPPRSRPRLLLVRSLRRRRHHAGDLGGAMREAVGPRASAEVAIEAAPIGSARQLHPSPGAVVGAINAVLPAARACLGADDPVRSATVVFRSDGNVSRVEISGDARSTDDCVRAALAKARTMPFVEDTFSARTTVRP